MLIRTKNGYLIEINMNNYLTDADYYREIIRIKEAKAYFKS